MGRFLVTYVLLVPRIARKHRLVQAPRPGGTIVFLPFLVLAHGRGGGGYVLVHLLKRESSMWLTPNVAENCF